MKNKIGLILLFLVCIFTLGCVDNTKKSIYPVEIVSCNLDKTVFSDSESVALSGTLVVKMSDDSTVTKTLEDVTINYLTEYTDGVNTITIVYTEGEYSVEYSIEIEYNKEQVVVGETEPIKIESYQLNKTNYTTQDIVIEGTIKVEYSDGSKKDIAIEQSMVTYLDEYQVGKNTLTITYTEKEITLEVEVEVYYVTIYPTTISSYQLDLETVDGKIVYEGHIMVTYSNRSTKKVDLTEEMIVPPTNIVDGNNKFTLKYSEMNYELEKDVTIYVKNGSTTYIETEIKQYLIDTYTNYVIEASNPFIEEYKDTGILIFFGSGNQKILNDGGKFTAPILDTTFEVEFFYYIGVRNIEVTVSVVGKGYGDEIDFVFSEIDPLVPQTTSVNYSLPVASPTFSEAKIEWLVDTVKNETGLVTLQEKDEDYSMSLECFVTYNGETRSKKYTIQIIMVTNDEKVNLVAKELTNYYNSIEVSETITLPRTDDIYGCRLTWQSFSPDVLTSAGVYICPFNDIVVELLVTVSLGSDNVTNFVYIKVKGAQYMNTWDKVEAFLARIHKDTIKTQKFYLYGSEVGYYQVPSQNIGYLPFYINEEVKVTEDILPDDSPLKANRMRTSTKYITLHNTGMAHPSATAKGLNDYIHSTDRVASWHFSIDDKEAYQELKLGEVGWHAGDGSYSFGQTRYNNGILCIGGGNQNSVGIEMCVYEGVDFNWVMRNTAKLVSDLLVQYDLTPACIRQHYDFAGKDCPQVIRRANRWTEMLELIALEYFARNELKGVEFTWESLNPEIMDNTGTVINNPGVDTQIKYKVTVKYGDETKVYEYESTLLKYVA